MGFQVDHTLLAELEAIAGTPDDAQLDAIRQRAGGGGSIGPAGAPSQLSTDMPEGAASMLPIVVLGAAAWYFFFLRKP